MWIFRDGLDVGLGPPGFALTLVGLGCHCRWLTCASAFIAESPWFDETAAVWSRRPTNHRLTPHAFREMKFILRQLLAHFSSVLGGGRVGWGGVFLLLSRQPCKMAPVDFLSLYIKGPKPSWGPLQKCSEAPLSIFHSENHAKCPPLALSYFKSSSFFCEVILLANRVLFPNEYWLNCKWWCACHVHVTLHFVL